LKLKLILLGIALAYIAFVVAVVCLIVMIVSGCAESDAVRYARMKYPDCDVTEVGRTGRDTTVEVRCKFKEPFRRTYRNRR